MNNEQETRLTEALELLLEGASLSSLIIKYPEHADELSGYEKTLNVAASLRGATPGEHGLHRALDAYQTPVHTKTSPQPSPFMAFFALYRGVLVLPILFIILIGAGMWSAYPALAPVGLEPGVQEFDTSLEGSGAADQAPAPVEAEASFKAAPESRMMLMSAPEEGSTTATSTASTSEASSL